MRQQSLRTMMARIVTPIDMWSGSQFMVAIPGPFIGPKAMAICAASAITVSQCRRRMLRCQRKRGFSQI
ncbi:hypothetical protein X743_03545 [Mesorhizobium sp. LNHC252B00]|nr:hypothetical protein X743_03545 [Mesorhizobium sp. LNHC252B00]